MKEVKELELNKIDLKIVELKVLSSVISYVQSQLENAIEDVENSRIDKQERLESGETPEYYYQSYSYLDYLSSVAKKYYLEMLKEKLEKMI